MTPITRTMIQDNGSIECYVFDKKENEYNRILTWHPWCRRIHFSCAEYRTRATVKYLNLFCSDLNIPVRTKLERGEFHSIEYDQRMSIKGGRALADPQSDPYDTLTINGEAVATMPWKEAVEWYLSPPPEYGIGEDD